MIRCSHDFYPAVPLRYFYAPRLASPPGMSREKPGWLRVLWQLIDQRLREINRTLKRILRILRMGRAFLILLILALVAAAVLPFLWSATIPYAIAVLALAAIVALLLPLILISAPLQAKSITRLIDKGYPANAKEMAIRVMAKKLHDESIETEELLWDTAANEARKAVRKYRDKVVDQVDEDPFRDGQDARSAHAGGPNDVPTRKRGNKNNPGPGSSKRCAAITRNGKPCSRSATGGSSFCGIHKRQGK